MVFGWKEGSNKMHIQYIENSIRKTIYMKVGGPIDFSTSALVLHCERTDGPHTIAITLAHIKLASQAPAGPPSTSAITADPGFSNPAIHSPATPSQLSVEENNFSSALKYYRNETKQPCST